MARLTMMVCLLVLFLSVQGESRELTNRRAQTSLNYNEDNQHTGLGRFTQYWNNCTYVTVLRRRANALKENEMLQGRDNDDSLLDCGTDLGVPDFCCRNLTDCERHVTERLGTFASYLDLARIKLNRIVQLRRAIIKTQDSIRIALNVDSLTNEHRQNLCSTTEYFINDDVAKNTLSALAGKLTLYLQRLQNFENERNSTCDK